MNLKIIKTEQLPKSFDKLIQVSKEEGYRFVDKTKQEWHSGKNSFSKNGEAFFLVYDGEVLVGCGGVNIDPYTDNAKIGRVRHLYVLPAYRRKGIARSLVNEIINKSRHSFSVLRLRANSLNIGSYDFYLSCGFQETKGNEFETHRMAL